MDREELDAEAESILTETDRWIAGLDGYQLVSHGKRTALEQALNHAREQKLSARPSSLLSVLLLGASGSGKSELLNALAGQRIAKSHHARPTTTRPTVYAHADLPQNRFFEYGTQLGNLAEQPGSLVVHRRPELRDKVIIDAPDIDSYKTEHRQIVIDLLPAVDVVLYVVTGWNYKDDVGWKVVAEHRGHRAFAFVLNKWDSEGRPPVRGGGPDVDTDFLSLLETGGWDQPLLFRTSAMYWVGHRAGELGAHEPPPPGDQLPELERWLSEGLSASEIAQIHRRKRRGLWGDLASAITHAMPQIPDAGAWLKAARRELGESEQSILSAWGPALESKTRSIGFLGRVDELTETPGPFGQMRRSYRRITARIGSSAWTPSAGNIGYEGWTEAPSVPDLLGRRLQKLEWAARESRLPIQWVGDQWKSAADDSASIIQSSLDMAAADAYNAPPSRARVLTAKSVSYACDGILILLLTVAVWNMARGFLTAQYVSPGFVANFLGLWIAVAAIGSMVVGTALPDGTRRTRRILDSRLRDSLRQVIQSLINIAAAYFDDVDKLQLQGNHLKHSVDQRIAVLHRQILETAGTDSTADRLYATAAERT